MTSIVSITSFALLAIGYVKLTDGLATATRLLAWTSTGVIAFFVFVGVEKAGDTFEHLWKYGIAVPVAMLAVAVVTTLTGRRAWAITTLLVLAVLSISLGFRSHGLVCLAVVLILFAKGSSASRRNALVKGAVAAALFAATYVALPAAIDSGVFGEQVRERTDEQMTAGASPILSGRTEPPLSLAAIGARFWFGWGNQNAIDADTIAQGHRIAAELGLTDRADYVRFWFTEDGGVSLHSVLFETWAQGGVLAAVWLLLALALFIAVIAKSNDRWSPVALLVSVQGIWDLLFSPWGAQRPTLLAISVVIAAWAVTPAAPPERTASP